MAVTAVLIVLVWAPVVLASLSRWRRVGGLIGVFMLLSGVGMALFLVLSVAVPLSRLVQAMNAPTGA
jgi:hypothetical protein